MPQSPGQQLHPEMNGILPVAGAQSPFASEHTAAGSNHTYTVHIDLPASSHYACGSDMEPLQPITPLPLLPPATHEYGVLEHNAEDYSTSHDHLQNSHYGQSSTVTAMIFEGDHESIGRRISIDDDDVPRPPGLELIDPQRLHSNPDGEYCDSQDLPSTWASRGHGYYIDKQPIYSRSHQVTRHPLLSDTRMAELPPSLPNRDQHRSNRRNLAISIPGVGSSGMRGHSGLDDMSPPGLVHASVMNSPPPLLSAMPRTRPQQVPPALDHQRTVDHQG